MFNIIQTTLTSIFSILLQYSYYIPCWSTNLLIIFVSSIWLNILFYIFILSGGFSKTIKNKFIFLLQYNINIFIFVPFVLFLYIQFFIQSSNILLEEPKVVITATLNNTEIAITGNALDVIFYHLGSAGVFAAGARVAAAVVTKNLHLVPRLGIIGGTGLGFTASYQVLKDKMPTPRVPDPVINIKTGPLRIDVNALNFDSATSDTEKAQILKKVFTNNTTSEIKPVVTEESNITYIKGDNTVSSRVLEKLDQVDPDWKDKFSINSPIENNEEFLQFITNHINNNLIIHFVILYFLFMLIIILTSKWALDNNIQFNWLKGTSIGNFVHYWLMKYISIWKAHTHIWIIYIIIIVIIFNFVSIYSLNQVLTALEILKN